MTILAAEEGAAAGEEAGAATSTRARRAGRQARNAYAAQAQSVGQSAAAAQVPGDRRYQGVILAEYLVAVLLITLSPIATGGSANAKTKSSPSPYDVNDLKQLVAVSGVYFVLALVASGNKGRFSAWFGGLILLAISMSKLGQGGIKAIADIVGQAPEPGQPTGTQLD